MTAFYNDIGIEYDLSLFIKDDAEEIEKCNNILLENFGIIKIVYIEGIAGSPQSYPEIGFNWFIKNMLAYQTPDMGTALDRARLELQFIRSTRGDSEYGLGGTLCRGEFLETIVRCASAAYPKLVISEYLQLFLDQFILPHYDDSKILR